MSRTCPLAALALFFAISLHGEEKEAFRPLLNGKDLSGWVVVNTAPSTWSFNE